jgi:hypothetical protein
MYGLKEEAGKLSNLRLVSLLQSFDFHQTQTPGLFRHSSRSILFVLVSWWTTSASSITTHPTSPFLFLGLSPHHNRSNRTFTVSYPGYVSTLLARLRPHGVQNTASPVNHPISTHSTRIAVVCSFVAKAEYGGALAAGPIATNKRKILADMGYSQPPTPIYYDNEVVIGLASDSIILKMPKSLGMRFHLLRDSTSLTNSATRFRSSIARLGVVHQFAIRFRSSISQLDFAHQFNHRSRDSISLINLATRFR